MTRLTVAGLAIRQPGIRRASSPTRTGDRLITNQRLYQLSYAGKRLAPRPRPGHGAKVLFPHMADQLLHQGTPPRRRRPPRSRHPQSPRRHRSRLRLPRRIVFVPLLGLGDDGFGIRSLGFLGSNMRGLQVTGKGSGNGWSQTNSLPPNRRSHEPLVVHHQSSTMPTTAPPCPAWQPAWQPACGLGLPCSRRAVP